ncbi:hypothetical protein [Halobacillus kuroshimensis]|nr:hypothetical protein [Halobacillus kuroshimensis]
MEAQAADSDLNVPAFLIRRNPFIGMQELRTIPAYKPSRLDC